MPRIGLGCGLGIGGPRAWTPTKLPGAQAYFTHGDAYLFQDAARTTPSTDTQPVGGWTDRSGQAHDGSQSNGPRRPTRFVSGLGGGSRPRLRFDESNDVLPWGAWCPSGACTVALEFSRYKALAGSAGRVLHMRSGSTYSVVSFVNFSGYTELGWRFGAPLASSNSGVGFSPGLDTTRHTLEIYYDGTGSAVLGAYAAWLDGSPATLALTGVYSDSTAHGGLGGLTDGTVSPPLDLGRVAVWDQDHRLNRAKIFAWLNA